MSFMTVLIFNYYNCRTKWNGNAYTRTRAYLSERQEQVLYQYIIVESKVIIRVDNFLKVIVFVASVHSLLRNIKSSIRIVLIGCSASKDRTDWCL
jgi:hypothetical protein